MFPFVRRKKLKELVASQTNNDVLSSNLDVNEQKLRMNFVNCSDFTLSFSLFPY